MLGLCSCTGSSLVVANGGLPCSFGVWTYCSGCFCCGTWALGCLGVSSCGSWALAQAQQSGLMGMWDPPGPGVRPVSPALAGEFFSTEPPGKPQCAVPELSQRPPPRHRAPLLHPGSRRPPEWEPQAFSRKGHREILFRFVGYRISHS